jgi:hypothetical protein
MRFIEEWKHWEERAEQTLAIAGEIRDPIARQIMLEVAASYEKMADAGRIRLVAEVSAE